MAEYFTIIEFAAAKKTTRQTVYNAINRNEIDVVRMYSKTLVKNNKKNSAWKVNLLQQRFKQNGK